MKLTNPLPGEWSSMYGPALDDELATLTGYLDQQLEAIRASVYGLTEEQARSTPCRSALSLGGILKHTLDVMRGALVRLRNQTPDTDYSEAGVAKFQAQFTILDGETTAAVLAEWDQIRAELLAELVTADPGAVTEEPPAPWYGRFEAQSIHLRHYLTHLVEEFARHAGHADIIREQLDGVAVPSLVMTLLGAPANPFFTPFEPQPGTIGFSRPVAPASSMARSSA